MSTCFRSAILVLLMGGAAVTAFARDGKGGDARAENWPRNPYWVTTKPPKGPGHKVANVKQLISHCGKDLKLGIKTLQGGITGNMGSFSVGDQLKLSAAIGDLNSKITVNHKGGGGGSFKVTLDWMDGKKVERAEVIKGGPC